jgi:hypothetical protein
LTERLCASGRSLVPRVKTRDFDCITTLARRE